MNQHAEPPVRVTAEELRHPAIRRLARACLALARLQLQTRPPATAGSGGSAPEASTENGQEEAPDVEA